MTRKEVVFNALKMLCSNLTIENIKEGSINYDASYIAYKTGIDRTNVSKELNALVLERRVIKIAGRPVYFVDKGRLEELNIKLGDDVMEVDSLSKLLSNGKLSKEHCTDPFENFIGYGGSLKLAIKQAKSAILYPPKGLHTLITGATGVGKTTFAEMMYKYATSQNIIDKKSQFIIFNCSEYAENPQLVISQLFGHIKGAFTGADKDKTGLIEKANGGIMLLDEIHRLAPECQEMLFMLMDKGIYRRLGETENYRKANVLFIGATTEDADSVLLKTFLRRIPMLIKLPSLSERPLHERMELIEYFFRAEVGNVNTAIRVHKNVLSALLMYDCQGNIGQLKGDIKLLCARSFLEYKIHNKTEIEIDTRLLPEYIYAGLLSYQKQRNEISNLLNYEEEWYTFNKSMKRNFAFEDPYAISENLYSEITNKYNKFMLQGYSDDEINEIISKDIDRYLKRLLTKFSIKKDTPDMEQLYKIVSPRVYHAVEAAIKVAEKDLGKSFPPKITIGFAIHISALIERISDGKRVYSDEINRMTLNNMSNLNTVNLIRKTLEEELMIKIPKEELGFISMFLKAVESSSDINNKTIGLIVIAHGNNTATSIASVANSLLRVDHCKALDMPLDEKVETALNRATEMVEHVDEGKGVLLLVDMGSLTAFPEIITQRTGIMTKSVEMVSTPIVIEALRKSFLPEMTLDKLAEEVQSISPYMGREVNENLKISTDTIIQKTIITTCITGEGAAVKIAKLLKKTLPTIEEYNIKIRTINISESKNIESYLSHVGIRESIIAVVGTIDLHIPGIPFIPIDELIIGDGFKKINNLISGMDAYFVREKPTEQNMFIKILEDTLTFLNPIKAYNYANESFLNLMSKVNVKVKDSQSCKMIYIYHVCCMVERLIQKEPLPYNDVENITKKDEILYNQVKNSLTRIQQGFGIDIPDTEIGYIMDLVNTQ